MLVPQQPAVVGCRAKARATSGAARLLLRDLMSCLHDRCRPTPRRQYRHRQDPFRAGSSKRDRTQVSAYNLVKVTIADGGQEIGEWKFLLAFPAETALFAAKQYKSHVANRILKK